MDTIEQLLQRGQQAEGGGVSQALLTAPEAEHIIGQLAPLSIEEVGSAKWQTQHDWIERLNLQAHYNAQTHSDEFVVELLVSLDKTHVLIHDLLLIEAWKELVYPLLSEHLAEHVNSVTAYLLLYHEVTVANLLQVVLYHSHAAESLSEDYALEVADWCYRKLTKLNADGHALANHRDRTVEEMMRMSRLEEQEEKRREVEFSVMMCSLAILRYVTDVLSRMPMGALSRVVSTNDTLMGLLPLLDRPPWVRTRSAAPGGGGRPVLEKWEGNRWVVVPPADRLKITQTDGQVWLAVTNLLVEPRCRAKYGMDEYRRERIMGLKRHLNELMFDQLPVLKDLQRVLDELALGVLPDQGGKGAALILEAVPVVRDAMLRGHDWRAVADRAKREHFGREADRLARERMEAMVKHLDFLCELEPDPAAAAKDSNGAGPGTAVEPHPPVKVSTWRKVHDSGVYESWYDFNMELDASRPAEPVEVAAAASTSATTSRSSDGLRQDAVHGLRYRLRPMDLDDTRPLPANGKAVVRWGALTAEALIQLPELPTRGSEEGAAVLWVTVGLLAVDGLVLQVKLKKAPKPKERDRVAGVWYAYHPVAGALTVLRDGGNSSGSGNEQQAAGDKGGGKGAVGKGGPGGAAPKPLVQVLGEPAPAGSPRAGTGAAGGGAGVASGSQQGAGQKSGEGQEGSRALAPSAAALPAPAALPQLSAPAREGVRRAAAAAAPAASGSPWTTVPVGGAAAAAGPASGIASTSPPSAAAVPSVTAPAGAGTAAVIGNWGGAITSPAAAPPGRGAAAGSAPPAAELLPPPRPSQQPQQPSSGAPATAARVLVEEEEEEDASGLDDLE